MKLHKDVEKVSYIALGLTVAVFMLSTVIVPSIAPKPQPAAVTQSLIKKAAVTPCIITTLNKCGRVLITKDTVPDAYQDFSFSTNIPGYSPFLLDDDATLLNPSVTSNTKVLFTPVNGSFNVWESTLMAGYATTVSCIDPTNNTTTAGMTANIVMDGGETISCTFTNTKTNTNPTIPPVACTPNTWTQKADFGGVERVGATGLSVGNKGYIGLGNTSLGFTQDFWEYEPTTNIWIQKANFGGAARYSAAGFSAGGKGYIGTGSLSVPPFTEDDLWEYDPTNNTWVQKANFGAWGRRSAVGFSITTKGYIGAGDLPGMPLNDFWEYDPTTNVWIQKANFGGFGRRTPVGFSIGGKGYIGTGFDNSNGVMFQDFWEYNPLTNTWTQKANFGGGLSNEATGFSIGGKGYIGTGEDSMNATSQDFWEYDPVTNIWLQKADYPLSVNGAVGFSIGGKGYIGTGYSVGNGYNNSFYEYCP